jgi:hypothetical protein
MNRPKLLQRCNAEAPKSALQVSARGAISTGYPQPTVELIA